MMKILFFYVGFAFLSNIKADLNGDCYLDGVTGNQWKTSYRNDKVDDNIRTEFKRFVIQNVTNAKAQGIDYGKYFDTEIKDGSLIILPTEEFANYEKNERSVKNPEMNIDLIFTCNTGSAKLAFYQPIKDLNTFTPEFSDPSYTYKLPMPLPADFNLLCLFGEAIEACDHDISNTRVDFSIQPSDDFSVTWESTIDNLSKCHRALVKTKNPVRLTSSKDYQLTVTDMGDPSKSSSVPLRIEVDEQTALPPNPQFKSPYYTVTYNTDKEIHTVTMDSYIQLEIEDTKTTFALHGDYKNYFEIESTAEGIKIKLLENLPKETLDTNTEILVTLEATLEKAEGPGRTVLIVHLPMKEPTPQNPQFKSAHYMAAYNTDEALHTIIVNGPIQLENENPEANFALVGDYKSYFEIETTVGEIKVKLIENLPQEVLETNHEILVTIEATLENAEGPGRTVLIVQLSEKEPVPPNPEFKSPHYTSTYNMDEPLHSISVNGPIQLEQADPKITFSLVGDYNSFFQIEDTGDEIKVKLIKNLPNEVLDNNHEIIMTIEATLANAVGPGRTILIVQFPEKEPVPPNPEFKSAHYTSTYSMDEALHSISVNGPIQLEKADPKTTFALVGDYNSFFQIEDTGGEIKVKLIKNLPSEVLDNNHEILMTIEATLENAVGPGRTILIVQFPEKELSPSSPAFKSAHYTAMYNTDTELHTITVNEPIQLENEDPKTKFALVGDYKSYFIIETTAGEIKVKLIENLPNEILDSNHEILVTIEATLEKAERPGRTVLIVQFPKNEPLPSNPQFKSAHYTATYNSDQETHIVTVNGHIQLEKEDPKTKFALVGDYKNYFQVEATVNEIKVKLVENLPKDVLDNNYELLITLEATLENAEGPGRTILIVYLPLNESNTPTLPQNPRFKSAYYTASYNMREVTHSITVDGIIQLEENNSDVKFSVDGDYKKYFDIEATIDEVKVKLVQNLPQEVLDNNLDILVTIQATLENAKTPGRTVLIVYLPLNETTTPISPQNPQFKSAFYTATYNMDEDTHSITIDGAIQLEKYDPNVKFDIVGDYVSYFEIEATADEVKVKLVHNLPKEVLDNNFDILVTIQATLENAKAPGRTVLVVYLPLNETTTPKPSLIFEKDNYWYEVKYGYKGIVGSVKAKANPPELIEYSLVDLEGASPIPELEIEKNTGTLKLKNVLASGTYNIFVKAKGLTTSTETKTLVVLLIKDDGKIPKTPLSISIEHIDENSESTITLPCPIENNSCQYDIIEQHPETEKAQFEYHDGKLLSRSINLQMEEIKKLPIPQFTLKLRLSNSLLEKTSIDKFVNNTLVFPKRDYTFSDENRELVLVPSKISNTDDELLMLVLIDDVNDHSPVFDIGSKMIVGYPAETMARQLAPPYVTKVTATDLDVGLNAKIKYTTDSTSFTIHPEIGVIYPTANAFNDPENLIFTVTATDRDGRTDGLSTHLKIEVKPLDEAHLAVLTIKNLMPEDIDKILIELSEKMDMKLSYLSASVVPRSENNLYNDFRHWFKSVLNVKSEPDHYTQIVLYALDNDDDPVETANLMEELQDTEVLEDYTVEKWEPSVVVDDSQRTGFIAAVSVLTILLVIFIIAASVFYYLKIFRTREEPYATMEDDMNSVSDDKNANPSSVTMAYDDNSFHYEKNKGLAELSFEQPPQRRATGFVFNPPPVEDDEDDDYNRDQTESDGNFDLPNLENVAENKRVNYEEDTFHLENKNQNWDSNENEFGNRSEEFVEKDAKKTVSFKPVVEKINIVVEDDKNEESFDIRL